MHLVILHAAVYIGRPEKLFVVIDCGSLCLDFDAYVRSIARREPRRLPACHTTCRKIYRIIMTKHKLSCGKIIL